MKRIILLAICLSLVFGCLATLRAQTGNIPVPGTANPWLADATSASGGDTAPAESPVVVPLVDFKAGDEITFSTTGSVSYAGGTPTDPPDGDSGTFRSLYHLSDSTNGGPENGIAGLNAPANSLVGVFLGPNAPVPSASPAAFLNFAPGGNVPGSIDYPKLAPAIAQPFFIGDGHTSTNTAQNVVVPIGATRLVLGSMDGAGWFNNTGSFNVIIASTFTAPPPPVAPAHGGLSTTNFTVDGSYSATSGLADTTLRFIAQQAGTPANLSVRVQASTTPNVEGSWTDLADGNGGRMTYNASLSAFVLNSKAYPRQSGISFRAIASAGGYPDSISNVVGSFDLTTPKPAFGSTRLDFTGNGSIADLYFRATESATPPGISVRVQSTTTPENEGSWIDLQNGNAGNMTQSTNPKQFLLLVNNHPTTQNIYFRAIATVPNYADSISNIVGPFDVTAVVPPAVEVAVANQLPGSGDGRDSDHPVMLSTDSGTFAARVDSSRPVLTVQLQVDGHTVTEYPGNSDPGTVYIGFFTPTIGDHVYEAVAINDLGARARAGTSAIYVRVVPPSSNAAKARQVAGSTAAAASIGHTYHVVISGGNWFDPNTWADENNNPGVPGLNDLAIVGSSSVHIDANNGGGGVTVGAASLSSGGVIAGPGNLAIHDTITLYGGSFENSTFVILASATGNLLNPQDVNFGGFFTNRGTLNVHGSGGVFGATEINNLGTINWLPPLQVPANAATDPAAALRIVRATSFTGNGLITGTVKSVLVNGGNIVASGGGNIVASGGGNIISTHGGGIVASGGGNIVASGGGNIVASGGGNIVASGGGNIVASGGGNFRTSQDGPTDSTPPGFTQTGGETDLSAVTIVGPVTLNGGTLSGTGFVQGDLTNNGGYIAPGHSAGAVAVLGNFTQGSNGTTIVEASGASGSQFDSVQVGGTANLGGNLHLKLINGYQPNAADTLNPISYTSVSGSFSSVSSNAQVSVNITGTTTTINSGVANPSAGQPLNIATRMSVQTGSNVLIAGFIVSGPSGSTKKVLIRGIGPSLAQFGVPGTLSDPFLELHNPDGSVVSNDNWQDGDTSQIPNGFTPSDPHESVIVATLAPGNYSAVVKGAHGETGVGIAELYDLDPTSSAKLANISTRGFINTGDDVMIGGFIVGGTEPAKILVRAIGPTLSDFGVQGALADPTLELHDANGATITNDNWRETQEAEIIATGLPPNKNEEPAILATLVPGSYTAVVRGKNNTTGIGLVEAYTLQ